MGLMQREREYYVERVMAALEAATNQLPRGFDVS
jgi:hypothetical protein